MFADKVDPDEATFANVLRAFSGDRIGHYSLKEIHQLCSLGVTVSKFHLNFQFKLLLNCFINLQYPNHSNHMYTKQGCD
ncbi:hypothetical protein Hanom_Chr11g01033871 [Helianthus anomalus]